jgi:hypothetical protein
MKTVIEDAMKLVEKIREIIREQYKEYEIKVSGVHIEKMVDKDEYAVTANFEASRNTQDGIIVIEQKIVFLKDTITYTKPYKYIK